MKKGLLSAAMVMAGTYSCASVAVSPSWDYVELGYVQVDTSSNLSTIEPKGFAFSGSKAVAETMFLHGRYQSATDDNFFDTEIDLDQLSLGIGYNHATSESTDLYGMVSYEYMEVTASGDGYSHSEDENGYGFTVGVRSMLTEHLELDGSLGHVDIDNSSDQRASVAARYYFTPEFSVGLNYSRWLDDEVDTMGLAARLSF